jgi:hypothetical protein
MGEWGSWSSGSSLGSMGMHCMCLGVLEVHLVRVERRIGRRGGRVGSAVLSKRLHRACSQVVLHVKKKPSLAAERIQQRVGKMGRAARSLEVQLSSRPLTSALLTEGRPRASRLAPERNIVPHEKLSGNVEG